MHYSSVFAEDRNDSSEAYLHCRPYEKNQESIRLSFYNKDWTQEDLKGGL